MCRKQTAIRLFQEGCACSQAILVAYGAEFGIRRQAALNIAAGFAGGMREGGTCGAVTGAYMVLGLAFGGQHAETAKDRAGVYDVIRLFGNHFRQKHKTLVCNHLLGVDISTKEGMKQAREQDLFKTSCVDFVRTAAEILEQLLPEN